MSLNTGDQITLTIHDLAFGGEGVGRIHVPRDTGQVASDKNSLVTTGGKMLSPDTRHPSPDTFVVFVPFVIVGETVVAEITEVKRNFARAKLLRVEKAAPERVAPECRYFGACGGCQYQHIAYPAQLRFKHKQIADLFERVGKISPDKIQPVLPCPSPYGYRNRIMIRSQWNGPAKKLEIGFIRADNNFVEDIEECKISEPALNEQIKHVRANPPPKGGIKVVLLPDNTDPDATVTAPANHYDAWATPTKYKLVISANSTQLDPDVVVDGAGYFVGQYIGFGAGFIPSLPEAPEVTANLWVFDGKYVNDSVQPYPTGSVDYFWNYDKLTAPSTHAWWVYGTDPSAAVSQLQAQFAEGLTFANGQHVSVTSKGLFNLYRPQVTLIPTKPGIIAADIDYLLYRSSPQIYLHFGGSLANPAPGVNIQYSRNGWLLNSNYKLMRTGVLHREQLTTTGINYITDSTGWDNDAGYGNPSQDSPAVSQTAMDSGGNTTATGCVTLSADDSFTEYLMFKYDGGSIDVPLKSVDWNWGGSASANDGWAVTSSQYPSLTPINQTPDFPKWTNSTHLYWTSHQP